MILEMVAEKLRGPLFRMGQSFYVHLKRTAFVFLIIVHFFSCDDKGDANPSHSKGIPHFYITTTNQALIESDEVYTNALITIDGQELYNDYTGAAEIRLRGNTSLWAPKKPYRIKLDKGASILGLAPNRDWVLLANWIDVTLLTNAVAMKASQLLEIPFTNHIIPVEVTVNGQYQGSYTLTEQIEVGKNRIDIADGGQLLELDQYRSDEWQFSTTHFDLPVMVKYPKLTSISEPETIRDEFEQLTDAMASESFPANNYLDYIDEDALVNYLIVMLLTDNEEINHPKSIFLYKPKNGKYTMGPPWDFDWGFGFEGYGVHNQFYDRPLFWEPLESNTGTNFFHRFLRDPTIKTKTIARWATFKKDKLPVLIQYVKDYSKTIEKSYQNDFKLWSSQQNDRSPDVDPVAMENWLIGRAEFLDSYLANF